MTVIISNAEVGGVPGHTVIVDESQVSVLPPHHRPTPIQLTHNVTLVDAHGAAVVPGLWDHHVHLRSLAARARSIDLTGAHNRAALAALLASAEPDETGWIRAIGYDDDRIGEITDADLDSFDSRAIPTRVQHRSGHLWVLNRAAQQLLAARPESESVSDVHGLTRVPSVSEGGKVWVTSRFFHPRFHVRFTQIYSHQSWNS